MIKSFLCMLSFLFKFMSEKSKPKREDLAKPIGIWKMCIIISHHPITIARVFFMFANLK